MKRLFILFILLLLTSLHLVYQAVGNVKAQDPSLYLDPKTGEERLVDTTIVSGSQIGYPFENMTNNFSSSFSEVLKEKEMIRVGKLEETFTFGIPLAQSFGTLSPLGKATTKGNTITYPKIYGGSDLRYTVSPERLLEEIIVPTREEVAKIGDFTQTLSLGKLTARKNDDGSITILKDNQGVVFTIPKPLLYELNNKKSTSDGVVYELLSEGGSTKLTKRVTEEGKKWLTDKRRHYPVVIDAAVTVATSTSANAMGTSFQSKVFFNPGTSNYWSFYYNGSAIAYSSSTDGVTWTARGTLSYNTFHFAISQRDQSNTIFLATQCGSDLDICVKKGTISGNTITWGSEYTALDGTDATTDAYTRPNIALSRMGNIWVAARKQTAASTFISTVRKSSSVEDPSAWASASTVGSSEAYLLDHILIPTTYQNMYMVVNGSGGDKSVTGYTYNGTSWAAAVTGGETNGGAPATPDTFGTGINGVNVSAQAIIGSDIYIGGDFFSAGGMPANFIARWNGTTYDASPGVLNNRVRAFAVSGTDLYVGGDFTSAPGVTINMVAKWNGTSWSALGGGMNTSVYALAIIGSDLYAGGSFTSAGGTTVNRIAKWNGTSWSTLNGGFGGSVYALAVSGTDLYAGGVFTAQNGGAMNRMAKWNGTSWSGLGAGMSSGEVDSLVFLGSDLIAGGTFTVAGGTTVNYIAKWNGTSWSALGGGMGSSGTVFALTVSGSDLYAGGAFTTSSGTTTNRIAKWNGTSWSALGGGFNNTVRSIYVSGSNAYVGGDYTSLNSVTGYMLWNGTSWSAIGATSTTLSGLFDTQDSLSFDGNINAAVFINSDLYVAGSMVTTKNLNGTIAYMNYVAKWNGTSWSILGTGLSGLAYTLAVSGTDLYVGGTFTQASGTAVNRIAKWNGTSWSALGGGTSGDVRTATFDGSGNLYVGGNFTSAGGTTVNHIAKWNGTSWSALGGGMGSSIVYSLITDGSGNLYAGGSFTTSGGVTTNRIAKWNGTSWSALGVGVTTSSTQVLALAISGTDLYIGGDFTAVGGVTVNRIAKWNGTSWSALGGGKNGTVYAIQFDESSNLIAGGSFTTSGGVTTNRIAKWNGTSWSALGVGNNNQVNSIIISGSNIYASGNNFYTNKWNGTSWLNLYTKMDQITYAFAASGSDLYVGGLFTMVGGTTVNYVAKWNGTSWSALGGGTNGTVRALAFIGTDLYAGGDFTTAGGVSTNTIAKWNGTSWSALGGGTNGIVRALAVSGTTLYVGGDSSQADGVTINYIAKWNGTSWSALGGGMNSSVNALAVSGTDIYAGGGFATSDGTTTNNIAKWNGTSWSAMGGGMNAQVNSLATSGTDLYVGGNFTTANTVVPANKIAKWSGTAWTSPGIGVNGQVLALIVSGTSLYAGGGQTYIGPPPNSTFTLYGRIQQLTPISAPDGGGGGGGTSVIAASASTAQEIATVSDFSDVTHLLYVDGNADVKYRKFSSSSWGSAVTLLTGTATNPSISINKANGDLYAFWMEGSTIKYKKGVAPYASGNWDASPTSYYATGTNATISAGSRWDGVFLQWTNGTGNPYGIMFDKLSAGTSSCVPPPGGALYVESNCAITGSIGGADDGDLLVSSGQAFTINASQTIAWGPGKVISIGSGGSINTSSTGQLKQTNMWMVDADGDGYPASTTVTAQTTTPGGTYVRRKALQTYTATDANDGDATVH